MENYKYIGTEEYYAYVCDIIFSHPAIAAAIASSNSRITNLQNQGIRLCTSDITDEICVEIMQIQRELSQYLRVSTVSVRDEYFSNSTYIKWWVAYDKTVSTEPGVSEALAEFHTRAEAIISSLNYDITKFNIFAR